jgi:hypothetical protein
VNEGLAVILDRAARVVEAETAALRDRTQIDLDASNRLKSEALLDLTRRLRVCRAPSSDAALRAAVERLQQSLADNQALLAMHIDAARTVAAVIVKALKDDTSDTTYALRPARQTAPQ